MKDKSKRLTVVNTEKKPSEKKEAQQIVVQSSSSFSSHAPSFNSNLYLLKSVWDSVFEIKTDVSGQKYIFGKLPVVTKYGITMYADDGNVDIPQLAEGLPYDQRTIWFNPETRQIEVIGGTGGGEGGVSNFWDLSGIPSWITNTKPIYNYSEINGTPDLSVFVTGTALSNTLADYATLTYLTGELKKYVTIKDDQNIEGVKNFLNGIKISNMPIRKLQDDVIYIDANLVVRGGVTMYYQDGEVDLPSIIDEIGIAGYDGKKLGLVSFSSSQFSIDANGNVIIKGGSTGLDTAQLKDYLDSNKYTTETWVKEQGYASATSLSSLQTKVNNFLEGSDTDTIINKWKELEAFLSGLSESDNLADILSAKANQSSLDATNAELATKWTTDNSLINKWNTAYGWGEHSKVGYALKSYVDGTFVTIKGNEDVTGVHDFVNGLKIGNIRLSKSQEGVVYLEGNLVVKGGVTMYALDKVTVDSIIDSLPLASTSQYGIAKFNPSNFVINEDGFVTIIGGSSGLDTKELAEYLTTNKYATQGWVEGKGYITSSALNGYATQSWVTNQKYITGITSTMVVSALGFTPYNSANFTKANIKSTLGISDWALDSTKPSYNFSEIGAKPTTITGYGITDAYTKTEADALYANYLPLAGAQMQGDITLPNKKYIRTTENSYEILGYDGSKYVFAAPNHPTSIRSNGTLTHNDVTIWDANTLTSLSQLTNDADFTTNAYVNSTFVTLGTQQTITGEKNFTGGLKVNGSPIYYDETNKYWKLEGDLLVTGGVTMYGTDEGDLPSILDSLPIASNTALGIASFDSTYFSVDSNGMVSLTSAPSSGASSLGELQNVDASIDATASVDRVLYQPAGSSTWTWKELTSSGVVGDYLPLSGGRLYGNLGINIDRSAHGLHVKGSVGIGQNTSGTATIDAFGGIAFFGCDVVINGVVQANKTAYIAANGNNGCVSVGHLDAQYKLDVLSSNHQVLKIESTAENLESSIRYVNKSKEVWVVGSQVGGYGNSFSFWHDNEAKTTMSIQKNGCFHVWFNGASIPNNNNTYVEGIRLYGKTKDNSWSEINLGCDPSLTYGTHSNQWVIARCGDAPYINELVFRAGGYDHFIFYRNGDFRVAGGITMYSDQRKKTILNHVELSLKQIADAPLIQHYYNSDQEKTTHVGSIAQYWAGLNDWFCKLDNEGYYTMEIQNCALASAISIARHLEKYESKTDKTIRKMKQRIEELENEVERLKQN